MAVKTVRGRKSHGKTPKQMRKEYAVKIAQEIRKEGDN